MKVFILGGTGLLGFHALRALLERGHDVGVLSLPDIELGSWFPPEARVGFGDAFTMSRDELRRTFAGYDALVYALGPDDRVTPEAPAYKFFHRYLVEACGNVVGAAREAGVKRCVVLSSYFCYFDRQNPTWRLAQHHPYIQCRNEQANRAILEGGQTMDVMTLELPYIFGTMPGRMPLWKNVLLDRIRKMKPVMFTKGGTAMITTEHVGEAVAGAVERGIRNTRYPIGDVNMEWKDMLRIMLEAMGFPNRKIVTVPTGLASLYGFKSRSDDRKGGKESGLDHARLFKDIQSRRFYLDGDSSAAALGYGRGGVEEAIRETVRACYPVPGAPLG